MTPIDRALLVKITQDLVRIPSVNPDLVPGAVGERQCAEYISDLMREWGLEVINRELAPGRFNALGILRGSGGGRSLLFNGHTDTVSVEGMSDPFSGAVRDGRLYGRGASDMKGSLAATLAALHAIVQHGNRLRGDVIFTFVADEEFASIGTQAVVDDIRRGAVLRPDGAVNTEATDLRMCVAHKGFAWAEVETIGKAAHGSRPELGVDAIAQMGKFLVALQQLQQQLASGARHPLLGTGSVHASLIHGGRELSSYPDRCTLQIERRTVPPESEQTVANELGSLLERLASDDPTFQSSSHVTFVRNPWQADRQAPIVKALEDAVVEVTTLPVRTSTASGWLDVALLADAGIPSIVYGPSGAGAHGTEEWVDLDSLVICARVYAQVMESFCG